ncbi:MAG: hypothetical protein NVSMB6_30600 [Burkholderiaceae bacterium]
MIEMASNAGEFGLHVVANSWGQIEMMSTDCQIHTALLLVVAGGSAIGMQVWVSYLVAEHSYVATLQKLQGLAQINGRYL